jgi:hypothetical protein
MATALEKKRSAASVEAAESFIASLHLLLVLVGSRPGAWISERSLDTATLQALD